MTLPKNQSCADNLFKKSLVEPRKNVMVRIPPALLERIDRAAKRRGLSRAAFMLAATAERVEAMESKPS